MAFKFPSGNHFSKQFKRFQTPTCVKLSSNNSNKQCLRYFR